MLKLILNAVIHRNYMMSSCVQVAVYDDRVEISSPGALYGTLTLEEALSGRSSIRNKLLASVCEKLGVVEGWGTGLKKIIDTCKELKIRPPEFLEIGDLLRVNFYRAKMSDPSNDPINDTTNDTTNDTINDTIKTTKSESKVLKQIEKNNEITREQLVANTSLSDSTVARALKTLQEKGIIEREGSKKIGFWKILNQGK